MRLLLTHHFPLRQSETGWLVWHWAEALGAAGHEVRLLIVDDQHRFGERLAIDRVVCGADPNADLTFPLPSFGNSRESGFARLSSAELAQYRDVLRRRLDAQVMHFNPHVIHVQHIWLLGQLALETGVPYAMTAWGDELADSRADARYRALAEQAAENAGRILAPDLETLTRVRAEFPSSNERAVIMPPEVRLDQPVVSPPRGAQAADWLEGVYRALLDERFGA